MGWKPKEKVLTSEEAVELARRELGPFWIGTEPLLAGVRGADGKATAHPLDLSFDKQAWLIFFADLTEFSGENVLLCLREWARRYGANDLRFLLVIRPAFSFLTSAKALKASLKKAPESCPVVLDHDRLITEAFGGEKQTLPAIRLLSQRKVLFESSGLDWVKGAEVEVQRFLRIKDPGLPLELPFELPKQLPHDSGCSEFGSRSKSKNFKLTGKTTEEADRILIQDPEVTVRFMSSFPRVSIVAQSAIGAHEPSRMCVELNGDTVFESVTGADLTSGDDGGSVVRVSEGRLYHILHSLPGKARDITLRFPDADRLPIALYAIRFSDQ